MSENARRVLNGFESHQNDIKFAKFAPEGGSRNSHYNYKNFNATRIIKLLFPQGIIVATQDLIILCNIQLCYLKLSKINKKRKNNF